MTRAFLPLARRRPLVLATLLALALALRTVGATLLPPSVEGWAAICSGGQVVYIQRSDVAPAPDRPASEPCKWFGLALVALPEAKPALPPAPPAAALPVARDPGSARAAEQTPLARGPPQAV